MLIFMLISHAPPCCHSNTPGASGLQAFALAVASVGKALPSEPHSTLPDLLCAFARMSPSQSGLL